MDRGKWGYIVIHAGQECLCIINSFLNSQMEFALPDPRFWHALGCGDDDWVYLAGGADRSVAAAKLFEKINLITGEVIKLKDLSKSSFYFCMIKF